MTIGVSLACRYGRPLRKGFRIRVLVRRLTLNPKKAARVEARSARSPALLDHMSPTEHLLLRQRSTIHMEHQAIFRFGNFSRLLTVCPRALASRQYGRFSGKTWRAWESCCAPCFMQSPQKDDDLLIVPRLSLAATQSNSMDHLGAATSWTVSLPSL